MGTLTLKPGLYAITDSHLTPGDTLIAAVEAALEGGAVLVQYREKHLPAVEQLRQASALQCACSNAGVPLLINDNIELALRVQAAGVHLGQGDTALIEARRLLGEQAIIGITCHADIALAQAACEQGANYLAFGRFYPSTTKPDAPAADTQVLGLAKQFKLPVTAIGGITLSNAEPLIQAGTDLLAVAGGLFSTDINATAKRAREFSRLFTQYRSQFSQSI
jgi:thiamine-phosphate pyrophosphorylase